MARKPVFYSFHYANDAMRVQQIRNIGMIDDNSPASTNEWEQVKRGGDAAIRRWIDDNMNYKRCVVVMIGTETAARPWVRYEIEKAWRDGRGLMGIYIHNLKCPRNGTSGRGPNPFDAIKCGMPYPLSAYVPCYDPPYNNAYGHIAANLAVWIDDAIARRA
jgi:hypothetical protein